MRARVGFDSSRSIAIIGMPGSGKTTVARQLARLTNRRFFDTDRMIAQRTGKSPSLIITQQGEACFRDLESEMLRIAVKEPGCVISTGGGVVVRDENYAPLKENCFIIQITRPLDALYVKDRPLSLSVGVEELYRLRAPLYDAWCDATVRNENSMRTARFIMRNWMI